MKEVCSRIGKNTYPLEEKIDAEIKEDFCAKEGRIYRLIENLREGGGSLDSLVAEAENELSREWRYEIQCPESAETSFIDSYRLKISLVKVEKVFNFKDIESLVSQLQEQLGRLRESMTIAQDKLTEICNNKRTKAYELETRINSELEGPFTHEDARIQEVVKLVKEKIDSKDPEEVEALTRKAKLALLKNQRYALEDADLYEDCSLRVVKEASLKYIDFEERKPIDFTPLFSGKGEFSLSFAFFDEDEVEVLKEVDSPFEVEVKMWEKGHEEDTLKTLTKELTLESDEPIFLRSLFTQNTVYHLMMRIVLPGMSTQWSDEAEFTTPEFNNLCVWKECPNEVELKRKYSVDEENPRIATKIANGGDCTPIGNTALPPNKVTSWSITILESYDNDGNNVWIGVAPFDINQNEDENCNKCGWYFDCFYSELSSGLPHNYKGKKYGPRKGDGEYVHTGDSVGVMMDTENGELSFVLNGVNLGFAYDGIPLDKPLVPCVVLYWQGDSVELNTSEVKKTFVDRSIHVPSRITTKSTTWDSITLTWNNVNGALFYQIEVDGSKFWDGSKVSTFTKRGLLPETEHTFRVRAVRGSFVSKWSGPVRGWTQKKSFEGSWWKECPDAVDEDRKYYVDEENPRIATKVNKSAWCTVIGNTPLPLSTVTSWSIKILNSKDNNGFGIYVGVAPSDIDQNEEGNWNKCGWYLGCYYSSLWSGPPHKYRLKEYGPRKKEGQYVHIGDVVGVVMDTAKGDLSFVVNGVNLGVAFEGIPLDKPLVPCVILNYEEDSVELDTFEVKEIVEDSSIPVPSNITTKSTTWDSITLTWNAVEGASFYQIEVDGRELWDTSTTNESSKRGLLAETEHSFRVRAVKGNTVSEWSNVVRGRTQKASEFSKCVWKECPNYVRGERKYSVDEKNPRIATLVGNNHPVEGEWTTMCTVIGDTTLPRDTVTSWSIKILKSEENNGYGIYIGVAPFDIDQCEDYIYLRCGWFFYCFESVLCSGPPHNYGYKNYGPRKKKCGQYIRTGDIVGVVMDTTKDELSFVLDGVNYGVAYEGIPLDKPLVPCVHIWSKEDSVELII